MPYDENGEWYEEDSAASPPPEPPAAFEGIDSTFDPNVQVGSNFVNELPVPGGPQDLPATPPYQGQAFPGLPVLVEGGQAYYAGERMPSEAAAFAARDRHAAASPAVQQQMQQRMEQQQATSIDIQQEISRLTPSPAEMLDTRQLQAGLQRIQTDLRGGKINQQMADQMTRQIQGQLGPRMMNQQQLVAAQSALRVQLLREQVMHQTQARVNSNAFWAANPAGSTRPIMDGERQVGEMTIDLQGNVHHTLYPRQPTEGRDPNQMSPQTLNQIHHDIEGRVHHIMNPPGGRTFEVPASFVTIPGESPEARRDRYQEDLTQRLTNDRIRRMGGPAGGATMSQQEERLQGLVRNAIGQILPSGSAPTQQAPTQPVMSQPPLRVAPPLSSADVPL